MAEVEQSSDDRPQTYVHVPAQANRSNEKRPSIVSNMGIVFKLNEKEDMKDSAEKQTKRLAGQIIETFMLIISLALAVMLLVTRRHWDEEDDIDNTGTLLIVCTIFATIIRVGTLYSEWSQFAVKNLSRRRYFLNNVFVSTFYTLHLMPFVMIDTDCEPINPVFGDKWPLTIRAPLTICCLYGLLIVLWMILFWIGRKIDADDAERFALVIAKIFLALTYILGLYALLALFVLCTAITSGIPLIYVELFSCLYYTIRVLHQSYKENYFCWKYEKTDFKKSYQTSAADLGRPRTTFHEGKSLMQRYPSLKDRPSSDESRSLEEAALEEAPLDSVPEERDEKPTIKNFRTSPSGSFEGLNQFQDIGREARTELSTEQQKMQDSSINQFTELKKQRKKQQNGYTGLKSDL